MYISVVDKEIVTDVLIVSGIPLSQEPHNLSENNTERGVFSYCIPHIFLDEFSHFNHIKVHFNS